MIYGFNFDLILLFSCVFFIADKLLYGVGLLLVDIYDIFEFEFYLI